ATLTVSRPFTITRRISPGLSIMIGEWAGNRLRGERISTASGSERVSINRPAKEATLATARGTDSASIQVIEGKVKTNEQSQVGDSEHVEFRAGEDHTGVAEMRSRRGRRNRVARSGQGS